MKTGFASDRRSPLRSALTLGSLACGLALASGCAGARTSVVADDAKYPVSLSRGVRDADGALVPADRRVVVGKFETKSHPYSLVYSFVPLKPTTDISDDINTQVAAAGGDAVVNLRVGSSQCWANWFLVLDLLPIWPGCTNVVIQGDVIKVKAADAPPPPAAAPPPPPAAAAPPPPPAAAAPPPAAPAPVAPAPAPSNQPGPAPAPTGGHQ